MKDRAPVNGSIDRTNSGYGYSIPWSVHEQAWLGYQKDYPRSAAVQDANRIAERGGFGVEELDSWAPGWREVATKP